MCLRALLASVALAGDSGGYLLATFGGAPSAPDEQIYFALSRDGGSWRTFNPDRPTLVSQIGDKGARAPFLIRSPAIMDRFVHMVEREKNHPSIADRGFVSISVGQHVSGKLRSVCEFLLR